METEMSTIKKTIQWVVLGMTLLADGGIFAAQSGMLEKPRNTAHTRV
jgi:hypothetical protein